MGAGVVVTGETRGEGWARGLCNAWLVGLAAEGCSKLRKTRQRGHLGTRGARSPRGGGRGLQYVVVGRAIQLLPGNPRLGCKWRTKRSGAATA